MFRRGPSSSNADRTARSASATTVTGVPTIRSSQISQVYIKGTREPAEGSVAVGQDSRSNLRVNGVLPAHQDLRRNCKTSPTAQALPSSALPTPSQLLPPAKPRRSPRSSSQGEKPYGNQETKKDRPCLIPADEVPERKQHERSPDAGVPPDVNSLAPDSHLFHTMAPAHVRSPRGDRHVFYDPENTDREEAIAERTEQPLRGRRNCDTHARCRRAGSVVLSTASLPKGVAPSPWMSPIF